MSPLRFESESALPQTESRGQVGRRHLESLTLRNHMRAPLRESE